MVKPAVDTKLLNEEIKKLKALFSRPEHFEQAKNQFLTFHAKFYPSKMIKNKELSFDDLLWDNLPEDVARSSVNSKGRTVLYGLWHSTRIEDITINLLVNRTHQIFTKQNFAKLINAGIAHTGNSLTKNEILTMSSRINIDALRTYRLTVGLETQQTIKKLTFDDLKRKVLIEDIERIRKEGAVDDVSSANWLLDFWKTKNVLGILFMPACRHQLVHLNENLRAKNAGIRKK